MPVKWYRQAFEVKLGQATDEIVRKVAFDIQAEAQSNAPVDTGFLKNSIYTVTGGASGYGAANQSGEYTNGAGQNTKRVLAPERGLDRDVGALICAGASYALFVELKQPFLYPAAKKIVDTVGGTIRRVGKEIFG